MVASRGTCDNLNANHSHSHSVNQSLKHPAISPPPMPHQWPCAGLQALIVLSLWDDKHNALKRRRGPQSKIVEMPVSIDDLQEARGHISASRRQEDCAFRIAEGSLEVLNCWTCLACHNHPQKNHQPPKPKKQPRNFRIPLPLPPLPYRV